jgi:hypothetical protein
MSTSASWPPPGQTELRRISNEVSYDSQKTIPIRYWYGPYEGYESRGQRRLQDDLGVDEGSAEAILRLRCQGIELQSHIRRLEADLTAQHASQHMRLARYQEDYYEATWIELEYVDDEK